MDDRFDAIARQAGAWSRRPDLPTHRDAIRILQLMALRVGHDPAPNPIATKSLQVLGCHVCRLMACAACAPSRDPGAACPLGLLGAHDDHDA